LTRSEHPLLLIDPYKNLLQAYALLLGDLGFPVDTAFNLQEARARLAENKYALIVCELLYPPKICLNFWQESKRENPDTFFIVLTDMDLTDEDYKTFFDSGIDDLLEKPCSPEKLLVRIRRGLRYRDLRVTVDRLKNLALMDPLTESAKKVVLDAGYFRQCLRQEMKKARRHREPFSLVMINNAGGADKDDHTGKFVIELAGLLGRNTREEDLLGRDRDAFGLILPRTGREGSQVLTDRLNGVLRKHPAFQEGPFWELVQRINFETCTYPDQTDLPEPYAGLLAENPRETALH
jgi:PleD family two-component response regulator